jgi:uncharacterized membrane protein
MSLKLIIMIVFFVIAPVIILYLETQFSIMKKVGAVLICYAIGLILGNIDILPDGADKYQNLMTLAIGLFTVVVMIFAGYYIFNGSIDEIWKVAGMLVGIYTGGTPNLAAMKTALEVDQELYIMTHTYELSLGALYLVFILSIGQRVFLTILPPFKSPDNSIANSGQVNPEEDFDDYSEIFKKSTLLPLLGAFGLSLVIVGVSYALSMLLPETFSTAAIILFITTFGIAFSFVPKIKQIKKTFQTGMYIILVFCLVVSSMADLTKLVNISFSLFWYVGLAMFGSHILHVFIAKFFKIDADTVIISGSALICSPPFVPVIAAALKNKEIILTGLTVGIAGYAVGNYLGVMIAFILK